MMGVPIAAWIAYGLILWGLVFGIGKLLQRMAWLKKRPVASYILAFFLLLMALDIMNSVVFTDKERAYAESEIRNLLD